MSSLRRLVWGAPVLLALLLWVLNSSRAGTGIDGCPEGCAVAEPKSEELDRSSAGFGLVRVMSLNMLHGFPRFERLGDRLDLISEEIRRQEADIVCLQEVPWTVRLGSAAERLAERTGLNHVYVRANGNRWAILFEEGEAILSRYPLRDASFSELSPRAAFFEHRVVLHAVAVTPWGDLPVFVTHLNNGDPQINRAQAASLQDYVASRSSGPALVAGDFNATDDSPQIQAIGLRWVDSFQAAGSGRAAATCCVDDLAAPPTEPLEKRIDYLFLVPGVSRTARVVSSQRVLHQPASTADGWLWASDHVGLLRVLDLD